MAEHFTYTVAWSEQDGDYVATCMEFPSLSHLAADPEAALHGVRLLVADAVSELRASNQPIPVRPAGDRLLQLWVPDTRTPEFAAEAARQSRLLSERDATPEDQAELAFWESLADDVWSDVSPAARQRLEALLAKFDPRRHRHTPLLDEGLSVSRREHARRNSDGRFIPACAGNTARWNARIH